MSSGDPGTPSGLPDEHLLDIPIVPASMGRRIMGVSMTPGGSY